MKPSQFHLTLGSLPLGALTQTFLWCLWAALHPNHRCFTAAFNLLGSTEVWVSAIDCEKVCIAFLNCSAPRELAAALKFSFYLYAW